jgi:hypothetical protein
VSITQVEATRSTRDAIEYQLFDTKYSDEWRRHKRLGTDRIAAMCCDAGTPEEFVALAEAIAAKRHRKVEALSLVQSFPRHEMDPTNPADVQRANDLGYQLARRLYPNSPVMVITHIDGESGCVHNHITVINDDRGKSIQGAGKLHRFVSKVNDQLMHENGLEVLVPSGQDRSRTWAERRGEDLGPFLQRLGNAVDESRSAALHDKRSVDYDSFWRRFQAELVEYGVTVRTKLRQIHATGDPDKREPMADMYGEAVPADALLAKQPRQVEAHVQVDVEYRMLDDTDPEKKARYRSPKASSIDDEFTDRGMRAWYERERAFERDEAAKARAPRPAAPSRPQSVAKPPVPAEPPRREETEEERAAFEAMADKVWNKLHGITGDAQESASVMQEPLEAPQEAPVAAEPAVQAPKPVPPAPSVPKAPPEPVSHVDFSLRPPKEPEPKPKSARDLAIEQLGKPEPETPTPPGSQQELD